MVPLTLFFKVPSMKALMPPQALLVSPHSGGILFKGLSPLNRGGKSVGKAYVRGF